MLPLAGLSRSFLGHHALLHQVELGSVHHFHTSVGGTLLSSDTLASSSVGFQDFRRRVPDDLRDVQVILPARDVDAGLLLLVEDLGVGRGLQDDSDKLPSPHGCRDVEWGVAILQKRSRKANQVMVTKLKKCTT